jgi:type II secretory pathway pseudopilin PulG
VHKEFPKRLLTSKRALALPLTYLILFVSLMAIISITYSFAIIKIGSRTAALKTSVAKQNMQALDNAILSVSWSFGASETVYMDDCGGTFKTEPTSKNLILNITDEQAFNEIIFNSPVGKAFYELEPSENYYDGLYIRGDSRTIVNESALTLSQLYFGAGTNTKELTLCYRPFATATYMGIENGKPLNLIRIYVINLNASQSLVASGKFYLKVTSSNVATVTHQYEFNDAISSLTLKAEIDGTVTSVRLSVSSSAEGAKVSLEIVICNVEIQRAAM